MQGLGLGSTWGGRGRIGGIPGPRPDGVAGPTPRPEAGGHRLEVLARQRARAARRKPSGFSVDGRRDGDGWPTAGYSTALAALIFRGQWLQSWSNLGEPFPVFHPQL